MGILILIVAVCLVWEIIISLVIAIAMISYFTSMTQVIRHEIKAEEVAKILTVHVADFVTSSTREYGDNLVRLAPQYVREFLDTTFLNVLHLRKDIQTASLPGSRKSLTRRKFWSITSWTSRIVSTGKI